MSNGENNRARLVAKMEQALSVSGGLLNFADVIDQARERRAQIWTNAAETALAATALIEYPRGRVCDIFAVAGELKSVLGLEARIEEFAREADCLALSTHGRPAWHRIAEARGWRLHSFHYVRRLGKLNGGGA
jgi:hypothetical protein